MIVSLLPLEGGDGLLIPLLPPSSGRRWRVAPEVGFALFRLRPPPALRASHFHEKGVEGLLIPPSSGRRWRRAPEVGFALFAFSQSPALRASPFLGKGGMGYSPRFSLLPLEGGGAERRRLASLFFAFSQPPALRASPFHGKGGRWTTHP